MTESTYLCDAAEVTEIRLALTHRASNLLNGWADEDDRTDCEGVLFHLVPICMVLGRIGGPLYEDET